MTVKRIRRGLYIAARGALLWRITHQRRPPNYLPLWYVDAEAGPMMFLESGPSFDTFADAKRYVEEWV